MERGQAVQLRAAMERLTWRAKNERFDKKTYGRIFRTFLFCVPPCAGARERQLEAGARLRRTAPRRSGME